MFKNRQKHQTPTFGYALFVVVILMMIILGGYKVMGAPVNIMFCLAWLFLFPACMYLGYSYQEINDAVLDQCRKGLTGVFIIVSVGAVIAAWIACGCVPALIYYGLGIISPKFFLLTTFLLCAIISSATGTSWGSAATGGMAMFAIGESMGVPTAMTVGAIASGAFFGDMVSPLSDSANIAAISVGSDLMKQCKGIILVAIPSLLVTGVIYTVMGFQYAGNTYDESYIMEVREAIASLYHLGIMAFIPLIVLCVLLFKQVPAMFAMLISALTGGVIAVFYQDLPYNKILTFMWSGCKITCENDFVSTLLNRGGMTSMFNTAVMSLFVYGVIGCLNKVGVLDVLIAPLINKAKGVLSLAVITEIISAIGVCFGHGGVAMLLAGTVMTPAYKREKLDPINLATVSSALSVSWNAVVPWTTSSIYLLGLFGISSVVYFPYYIFAIVNPLMALLFAALHIHEIPLKEKELETE